MAHRTTTGAAMVVGASVTIQLAAALAHDLFDQLGPLGVSAWRFGFAAVVLLAVVRPAVRGRDRGTWRAIVAYGLSLAALNVTFFAAIDRIPMGIAVTLAFAAPLVMSVVSSARRADVGVGPAGRRRGAHPRRARPPGLDPPASSWRSRTGGAWVVLAYAARSVGRETTSIDGLALATPVAALAVLPLGASTAGEVDVRALGLLLVIAVGGLIVPFALELEALRRLEPRLMVVIYSVDPGIAAIVGLIALDERLSTLQVVALAAVTVASVGATAGAARRPARRSALPIRRGRLQHGLGGREAGDRHPERRAGHVVEPDARGRTRRGRVAAVLAADADLEVRAAPPGPAPTPMRDQLADAVDVERSANGSCGRIPVLDVVAAGTCPASSRESPSVVCVRSLVPNEKKSACSAIWSAHSAARGSSIIVPTE